MGFSLNCIYHWNRLTHLNLTVFVFQPLKNVLLLLKPGHSIIIYLFHICRTRWLLSIVEHEIDGLLMRQQITDCLSVISHAPLCWSQGNISSFLFWLFSDRGVQQTSLQLDRPSLRDKPRKDEMMRFREKSSDSWKQNPKVVWWLEGELSQFVDFRTDTLNDEKYRLIPLYLSNYVSSFVHSVLEKEKLVFVKIQHFL